MLINDNFPELLTKQTPSYRPEQHLKDYIDAGQGLSSTLDDLAHQFNYNKYYLERCFKDTYGVSVMAYRNKRRMQTAKELLHSSNVSSVSEQLGFTSIYVFSRAFKSFFGISPSEYRNTLRQ
jgi:AraC-like DNA-binding protein